jgi:hypothetical protein
MKKTLLLSSFVIALLTIAATGHAQTTTPRITERQANQQERISQGVKSGELTGKETRHLEDREAKIQHDKRMAKSDGTVTQAERAKLNREENRTSHAIYRQKHDAQVRK